MYFARMWGRTIGAFFYIPAGIMWARGMFSPAIKKRVAFAGVLLACQEFSQLILFRQDSNAELSVC